MSRRGLVRTRRQSKIGLIMVIWLGLIGWIGIASYNVIKQGYSSVYAQNFSPAADDGHPDEARGSGGSSSEPVAAGPGGNASAGVLLTSGLVVFTLATVIRLMMNRRTQNDA